jgi:hypothetical protein
MSTLERRYRRVLRLLPGPYRRAWEDDMVATFLATELPDNAEDAEFAAEFGRPSWSEVASVVALAVRLRLGGAGAPPRYLAWGDAVRRVALVGLLVLAVQAIIGVGSMVLLSWRFPELVVPDHTATVWMLLQLGWVAAYLALVLGHWHAARTLAVLSLLPAVISYCVDLVASDGVFVVSRTVDLLVTAAPLLAMAAFHREAAPVRPRPWLVALPVGVGAVAVVVALTQFRDDWPLVDWSGILCVALVATAITHLLTRRGDSWPVTLSLLAVAVLGQRVVTLFDYLQLTAPDSGRNLLVVAAFVEILVVVVAVVPLAVRAARTLRGLPRVIEPSRAA